jgi:hypothetical protein
LPNTDTKAQKIIYITKYFSFNNACKAGLKRTRKIKAEENKNSNKPILLPIRIVKTCTGANAQSTRRKATILSVLILIAASFFLIQ